MGGVPGFQESRRVPGTLSRRVEFPVPIITAATVIHDSSPSNCVVQLRLENVRVDDADTVVCTCLENELSSHVAEEKIFQGLNSLKGCAEGTVKRNLAFIYLLYVKFDLNLSKNSDTDKLCCHLSAYPVVNIVL